MYKQIPKLVFALPSEQVHLDNVTAFMSV